MIDQLCLCLLVSENCDKLSTTAKTLNDNHVPKIRTRAQTKLLNQNNINNKNLNKISNNTDNEILKEEIYKTVSHINKENVTVDYVQISIPDKENMNNQITNESELTSDSITTNVRRSLDVVLKERPVYMHNTLGFQPIIDIWNVDKKDLELIDTDYICYTECDMAVNFIREASADGHYIKYEKPLPVASNSKNSISIKNLFVPEDQTQSLDDSNKTKDSSNQFKDRNIYDFDTFITTSDSILQNSNNSDKKIKGKRRSIAQSLLVENKKIKNNNSLRQFNIQICPKKVKVCLEKLTIHNLPKLRQMRVLLKRLTICDLIRYKSILLSNPEQHLQNMPLILDKEKSTEVDSRSTFWNRPRCNTVPLINMDLKNKINQITFNKRSHSFSSICDNKNIILCLANNDCYIDKHTPGVTNTYDKSEKTGTCVVEKEFDLALKNIDKKDELVEKSEFIDNYKTHSNNKTESMDIVKDKNRDGEIMPKDENNLEQNSD